MVHLLNFLFKILDLLSVALGKLHKIEFNMLIFFLHLKEHVYPHFAQTHSSWGKMSQINFSSNVNWVLKSLSLPI